MFQLAQDAEKGNGAVKKTLPNKKVRWMINTPSGEPTKMTITPEIAAEMLAYNDPNRPLSKHWVKHLARQMVEGKWRLTPAPIIFSDKGRLTDGQHRLAAVVETGLSQEFWVFFGDDDENFFVIDTGARRNAAHIFSINGVKDCNSMAAATRIVFFYDNKLFSRASTAGNKTITNEELWEFYKQNEKITESTRIGEAFYAHRLASKSLMIALHYICARKNRTSADEFFLKVATGVGLKSKNEPAARLHAKLIELAASPVKARSPYIAALTIKAWNAHRDGLNTLRNLTYRPASKPDEAFPRAR